MSTQQIKWEKEKALMQQKIEQLETRLVESQDREQRLKKSHQFLLESLSKMNQNEEGKKTMFLLVTTLTHSRKTLQIKSNK